MARGILADPNDTTSGGFDDFMRDPVNVGLLSAVFGGLAGAQRNQPINNLGRMGMAGVMGYQNAMPAYLQQKQMDMAKGLIYGDQSQPQQPYGQVSTTAFGPNGVGSNNPSQDATAVTQVQPVRQSSMLPAGVNRQAAGLLASQGKWDELAKMIQDVSKPDIQVSNGYAYDKNKVQPGFLPQLNISQNGQAALTTIDPRTGLPVVTAPQGALGTYSSYQNAGEAAKARYNLMPLKTPNGTVMVTAEQAAQMAGGGRGQPSASPGMPGGSPTDAPQNLNYTTPDGNTQLSLNGMSPADTLRLAAGIKDPADRARFLSTYYQATGGAQPSAPQAPAQPAYAGPGIQLQTDAQGKFADARADNAAKYSAAINDKVSGGNDLMDRIHEQQEALKSFKPGANAGVRLQIAQFAQGMGAPQYLVDKISGGDLGAMQEFQKLAVQGAMESLKQSMATDNGMGGRITQAEFGIFQKNNPNIEMDPRGLEKVYAFINRQHQINLAEQQGFESYIQNGGDPSRWQANWSLQRPGVARNLNQPAQPAAQPQQSMPTNMPTVTLADIAATAKASGRSPEEVTAAMKAKGWKIGGQ